MNPNIGINHSRSKYIQCGFNNFKSSESTDVLKFSDTSGSANSATNNETSYPRKYPGCFALQIVGFVVAFILLVIVIPYYFSNYYPTTRTVTENITEIVPTLPTSLSTESINSTKTINESQSFSYDTCRINYENEYGNSTLSAEKPPWLVRIVYKGWDKIYQCTGNIIKG